MNHTQGSKVSIIGAGAVGATTAYALLMRGSARTVALMDINQAKVDAEVLDLAHGSQFTSAASVIGGTDAAVCADSDIIVFTAGAKQKPGQTRLQLAETTVRLAQKVLPDLVDLAPNAIHVLVTNPVDIVTYAALKATGLPPNQVFGSGTVLDSSRLRYLVAQHTGVAVQNVHAYIAGEHGDSQIPLWSSATIGAIPLMNWTPLPGFPEFDQTVRDEIAHEVVHSAYQIIEGKGATNYAIGLATARIVEAVLGDERRILPVSTLATGFHGIGEVCLSLPSVVDRRGCDVRLDTPLSDQEEAGLLSSATTLRGMIEQFGL